MQTSNPNTTIAARHKAAQQDPTGTPLCVGDRVLVDTPLGGLCGTILDFRRGHALVDLDCGSNFGWCNLYFARPSIELTHPIDPAWVAA